MKKPIQYRICCSLRLLTPPRNERRPMTRLVCLLSLFICATICARPQINHRGPTGVLASGQNETQEAQEAQEAQTTRGIIPAEFVKARPAKAHGSAHTAAAGAGRPQYHRTSGTPVAATANLAQLGLTMWRLRPATGADTGARLIVQKESETIEFVPERLPSDAPLHIGDRIRMSFESPRKGYLYVIDREQFADGNLGEPVLIFPTTRTRDGDNQVAAGKLIEIPAQEDQPNYFTLQQSGLGTTTQTGEVLTVIVTAKPLEGLAIGSKALTLGGEQVQQWERQWGARTETFDLAGGAGKPWTRVEQEAGAKSTRQLTQEDPEPQTIYRVAVRPGAPLLVKVGLHYGGARAAPLNIRR